MPNWAEIALLPRGEVGAVALKSAMMAARMSFERVCSIALWLVCNPMGNNAKTAVSEIAATPIARVTSTREKARTCTLLPVIVGRS